MSRYERTSTKFDVAEGSQVMGFRFARPSILSATFSVMLTAGDTYESLAYTYYGNSNLWWVIADQNPLLHPLFMDVGTYVRVLKPQYLEANRLPMGFGS